MLAPAIIACKRPGCGQSFHRKRLGQLYCSERCRKADFKRRTGSQRSVALDAPATVLPEKRPPAPAESPASPATAPSRDFTPGPTPGALQGDDYPLEYYEDGYPKLPASLDRTSVRGLTKC